MAHANPSSRSAPIGSRRLVVGAHYGLGDWLAQRLTSIVVTVYTLILLIAFLSGRNFSYGGWAGLFAQPWMKVATVVALVAVLYHCWVGIRDIWMDYVKPTGIRLLLQFATVVWLFACGAYAVLILWRV